MGSTDSGVRRSKWLPRWGLRTFLVFIGCLCLLLGYWTTQVRPYRQQAVAADCLRRLGCQWTSREVTPPIWSRWLVPADGYRSVESVDLGEVYWILNPESLRREDARRFEGITRDCPSRDEVLDALSGLSDLESLSLRYCEISDEEFRSLRSLSHLEELSLTGCPVTDKSIGQLADMPKLRTLILRWTRISPEGVERLRTELPECEILYRQRAEEAPAVGDPDSW